MTINAEKYAVTTPANIPTGELKCVSGTPFDLRLPKEIGPAIVALPGNGFDDNFCINTKGDVPALTFVSEWVSIGNRDKLETIDFNLILGLYILILDVLCKCTAISLVFSSILATICQIH